MVWLTWSTAPKVPKVREEAPFFRERGRPLAPGVRGGLSLPQPPCRAAHPGLHMPCAAGGCVHLKGGAGCSLTNSCLWQGRLLTPTAFRRRLTSWQRGQEVHSQQRAQLSWRNRMQSSGAALCDCLPQKSGAEGYGRGATRDPRAFVSRGCKPRVRAPPSVSASAALGAGAAKRRCGTCSSSFRCW